MKQKSNLIEERFILNRLMQIRTIKTEKLEYYPFCRVKDPRDTSPLERGIIMKDDVIIFEPATTFRGSKRTWISGRNKKCTPKFILVKQTMFEDFKEILNYYKKVSNQDIDIETASYVTFCKRKCVLLKMKKGVMYHFPKDLTSYTNQQIKEKLDEIFILSKVSVEEPKKYIRNGVLIIKK